MRLLVLRHGRSCANLALAQGAADSEQLRDPPLTEGGARSAAEYRPHLHRHLIRRGFEVASCCVGASGLLRARQTAALLFPNKRRVRFRGLGENGAVPENTPAGESYRKPDWSLALREAAQLVRERRVYDLAVVAHGTFMRGALSEITGYQHARFSNLSGFLLHCRLVGDSLVVESSEEVPCEMPSAPEPDRCPEYYKA